MLENSAALPSSTQMRFNLKTGPAVAPFVAPQTQGGDGDCIKALEHLMANATTPIFFQRKDRLVVGTGFFYRNSDEAIIITPPVQLPIASKNDKNSAVQIVKRIDFPNGLIGFLCYFFAKAKQFWQSANFFIFQKTCDKPTENRLEPILEESYPPLFLVTTKTIFQQNVDAIEEPDLLATTGSTEAPFSFYYRILPKRDRVFTFRFRLDDVIQHASDDLAAVNIGKLISLNGSDDEKQALANISCLSPSCILGDNHLAEHFGVAERVTLFGFCYNYCSDGGKQWLEDEPIARTGFTAFPPSRNFHGNAEGIVSMISFSGFDCGAPLMMRKSSTNQESDQNKACFLGILRQWHSADSLTADKQSEHANQRMILGRYVKAGLLLNINTWMPFTKAK